MDREELYKIHETTCMNALVTMKKKNQDYSSGDDPFKNFRGSLTYGIHPGKGILLRISDKLQRVDTYITSGELKVTDESFSDSIEDAVNYLILLRAMLIDEGGKEQQKLILETNKDLELYDTYNITLQTGADER